MTYPNNYRHAQFLLGAHQLHQLPPDEGMEVAFAGRSNAGKSSALNVITGNKGLARTSKTPGRTQQINVFVLDEQRRLADLPGYGYAKVPPAMKDHWRKTLERYFNTRRSLCGLVLVMDIRHPLNPFDQMMTDWCIQRAMPLHILLTKADKLKRGPAMAAQQQVRGYLQRSGHVAPASVQLFSAHSRQGVDEARQLLDDWFGLGEQEEQDQDSKQAEENSA